MKDTRKRFGVASKQLYAWVLPAVHLATLLVVFLLYHVDRQLVVNVGDLGDSALVSKFYADEPDLDYRYRWSKDVSEVAFCGAGSAALQQVHVVAQGARPGVSASLPVTMSLAVNGQRMEPSVVTLTQNLQLYTFQSAANRSISGPFTVTLNSSTFSPSGDGRELGVKIDSVSVTQSSDGINWPPLWVLLWSFVLVAGVYGLLVGLRWRFARIATIAVVLLLFVWITTNLTIASAYLPLIAVVIGVVGLLLWQRRRIADWPRWVDALHKVRLSTALMLGAMLLYAALALWTIAHGDWIGHADYAENAVIARNLVEGRGLTVDYVAQFYKDYPGISHPAETWPLLQPLMIAPFFAVFGPETWAAKLPNLFVMLALAWAVYSLGSKLWDPRVGLLAGILTLAHPYFFNSVLYPINDLGFTALFFALAWLVWRQVSPLARAVEPGDAPSGDHVVVRFAMWRPLFIGLLAGLLVWSKPSGATLLVGLALWATWTWRRGHSAGEGRIPWRVVGTVLGTFALVILPLVIRNILAFHTPYFTTESYDAPILRYWPQVEWENIYKVYAGGELPHPRWIVGGKFGYQNLFDAIGTNLGWVWQQGVFDDPGGGNYVLGLLPLAGAMLGLASLTRRAANLFGMVFLSLGLYAAFVLFYWHFEGRYFQVAVPWLLLLLAWALLWAWDQIRDTLRGDVIKQGGLLFLPLALVLIFWPHVSAILGQASSDSRSTGYVAAMKQLTQQSTAQDVVMTRDPWELNWYTRRRAVMIPFDDLKTVQSIEKQYGVTMLQLGGPVDRVNVDACPADPASKGPFPTGSRPALGGLYCGREQRGYSLIYRQGGGTLYRIAP